MADAAKLQKLSPMHKQALSLVAQGVDRSTVAEACGFVPEYITWLLRQDVCQEYLAEMRQLVDFQLETMTQDSVDTIRDVMRTGSSDERLKAAKLQMEAVGRVGNRRPETSAPTGAEERLSKLAERLVGLLKHQNERVINGTAIEVYDDDAAVSA